MNILIINSAEKTVTDFHTSIENILTPLSVNWQTISYRETIGFPLNNFDGVIITGSPRGDDIVESHQPYFQWIKEYQKPVMGICAGHHVIGFLYGAEYLKSIEPENGKTEVEIIKADPIFSGISSTFSAEQMHNDSITLPKKFIHLAQSKVCNNQAMRHQEKPLYSFQFHPEFHNYEIFSNFIQLVDN